MKEETNFRGYKTEVIENVWIDHKGRKIEVHTMSNKWLNNIKKRFRADPKVKPIIDEIKRRKQKL